MKRVCVVTSTRADYGLLSPLIRRLSQAENLELCLAVTGTHLSEEYGYTIQEIEKDGYSIHSRIPILTMGKTGVSVPETMANAIRQFGDYFHSNPMDMLVVLGDRYEICAVCMAAVNAQIPIAHIHGGETTEGAMDECFRHSITKMSYLHFTANAVYRRRVIQLGEAPERVFDVGALGVENALGLDALTPEQFKVETGFDPCEKPYGIVTFHPVTLEEQTAEKQLEELLAVLAERQDMKFLITKSNADAGGTAINAALDRFVLQNPHCKVVTSLGMKRYLSALKYACCVVGNSSSGILEAPSFGIPTVNIGDRQRGRMQAESIINCLPVREDIAKALEQAVSPDFQKKAGEASNPYGHGETSRLICEKIEDFLCNGKINLKKTFFDLNFEVSEPRLM